MNSNLYPNLCAVCCLLFAEFAVCCLLSLLLAVCCLLFVSASLM